MKKFASFLLAVLFILCLSIPVFAAGEDGSIAAPFVGGNDYGDNTFNGIIHLTKFDIGKFEQDKLADLQVGAPDITRVQYTGKDQPTGAALVGGDVIGSYQAYKGSSAEGTPVNVTLAEMTVHMSNIPFEIIQVQLDAGKTPGSTIATDYEPLASGAVVTSANGNTVTDGSGEILWEGLPSGYYKITEQINVSGTAVSGSSYIVSLPMVDPADPSQSINEIYMYPKNRGTQGPTIEKEPPAPVNGNVFSWTIKAEVPASLKSTQGKQEYVVTDTMANGLEYANNLKVFYENSGTVVELVPADYTVAGAVGGSSLQVTLNTTAYTKLAGAISGGMIDQDGGKYILYLTYDTVVNLTEDELTNLSHNPQNKAKLDFTNSDGNTYTDENDPIPIDDFAGISVLKFDAADDTIVLEDAEFKIYTAIKTDGDGNTIGDPSAVLKDGRGNAIVLTTDSDGKASYVGIHTAGTYYLEETNVPTGYKKLTGVTNITITAANLSANDVVEAEVANYRDNGFTLPQTGGIGTTVFIIIGIALIVVAGVLFVVSGIRRKTDRSTH